MTVRRRSRGSILMRSCLRFFLLWATIGHGANGRLIAQATPCDPSLAVNRDDPWQYKRRGSRCEGRYLEPVGSASLRVVGYYVGAPWTGSASGQSIWISWPAGVHAPVRLRATSLRWRTFYRMDAVVLPEATRYQWPSEVLRGLQLAGQDIALTATSIGKTALGDARLFLPVTIGDAAGAIVHGAPTLVLVSDADLDEVQLAAIPVAGSHWSRPFSPIRRGTFVAGRPIRIPLTGFPSGTYRLMMLGSGSGSVTTGDATVYVPPESVQ
jgi:hypothetical protein